MLLRRFKRSWNFFSLFVPCDEEAPRIEQEERFVNQDNVLIERLIFDLGLRCEPP